LVEKEKLKWVYLITGLFIALNTYFISQEMFLFTLIPAVLVVVLISIYSLDKILYLIVFCTPLSYNLQDTDFGVALSVPTEPLLFGVLILFLFKLIYTGKFDQQIARHPITKAVLLYLLWILFTSITSSFPIVSFKFLLVKVWFLVAFYFLATMLFKKYENISRYIWFYIIPFIIVIFYTLYNHSLEGFKQQPAHTAMVPFYNDHTSYGAVLAMFIPLLIVFLVNKSGTRSFKLFVGITLLIFIVATIFSYTRAAWVSLVGALVFWLLMLIRIRFSLVLSIGLSALAAFFAFKTEIMMDLKQNEQASSQDIAEHVQSISNITTDESNMERINRWQSALRMFENRPLIGWGPGTYQFNYAPFQFSYEKTNISTNMGDRGNAHSEYIGPLAEQGVFGMLTYVLIYIILYLMGI
jgi:O-antigen ligase